GPFVVGDREAPLGFAPRHYPPRAVTAAMETLVVAQPAHDVRARAHAARDDTEIALARAHRPLARHEHILFVVELTRDVVVVAVDPFDLRLERRYEPPTAYGLHDRPHHQLPIDAGVVLRPPHRVHVIVESLRPLGEVC